MTESKRNRVKLAIFALTFLILGGLAFVMPAVQTQDPPISPVPFPPTVPLEGNMTFTLYPDESIKMKVIGSIEQAIDVYSAPPVYEASLNLASSPSGVNLTETKGIIVVKLSPMYSTLLAALELDIKMHGEGLNSNTTILFNLPGFLSVSGTTGAFTDESTGENNLDFDLTATIWYSVIPEEVIQGYVEMFPLLQSQMVTQISELMEGNVTLQDLTLSGEIGFTSATLTIAGSLVGDFVKGGNALSTNLLPLLGIDPEPTSLISQQELMIKPKSADIHIRFDRNELAFLMDSEGVIEGDLDRQINVMKDIYLEQILQSPDIPKEWALMVNNVLLPTEISGENLNMAFEYSFDGEKIKLDFVVEGLEFRPPTTGAFLKILDKALTGGSAPGFSLIFEGGSDEEGFVEIEVPPATSEPVIEEPRKVVWIIDDLANLNWVSFKFRPHLKPAEFVVSDLSITPEETEEGETVTVSVDVTNIGEATGDYTVTLDLPAGPFLRIQETVSLEGGESKRVEFEVSRDIEGIYAVTVDDLTSSFTVKAPLKPAELEFSNLRIFYPGVIPPEVEEDQTVTVTVSIDVTNVGEEIGGCTVELKVNGEVVDSVDIAAFGGIPPDYDQVTATQIFQLTRGEGTYQVEVEGLTETFTVSKKTAEPFWTQPGYAIGIPIVIASAGAIIYLIWKGKLHFPPFL